jgi:hypothetical protein
MKGDLPRAFDCTRHSLKLPVAVRIFCSGFTSSKPGDTGKLDEEIARLTPQIMYVWLETVTRDGEGQVERHFDMAELTTTEDFRGWTREQFVTAVRALTVRKHAEYRLQGYQISWVE